MKVAEKLIPELRFPDFVNEWKIIKLGVLLEERKSVADSNLPLYSLTIEEGIVPKSKRYERSFLVKKKENSYKKMKPVDFAFNPMNLRFGALAMHKGNIDVAISKYYNIFHCSSKADPDYLESYFISYNMIQYYNKMATGTLEEKKRVHYLDFINFKKPIATLPEQKKIASFFSIVDKKIEKLTHKKKLLEKYKKGVIQKIFSQEIRFLGFEEEWKVKSIQNLINNKVIISHLDGNHGALYPKNEEFTETGIPYVTAKDLLNGNVETANCKKLPLLRVKQFKKGIAKNGDVLFAHNATVGPVSLLETHLDYVILSTTVTYFRCDPNYLHNKYLLFYFQSENFIRQYYRVMFQSTRCQVPITTQRLFSILLPSITEQQKIANFLSNIDKKIESVQTQLTKTQTFKKGLLQKMFV